MQRSNSEASLTRSYYHPISEHNYFHSPKMPVRDHSLALKTLPSSFRRPLPPLLPVAPPSLRKTKPCWRQSTSTRSPRSRSSSAVWLPCVGWTC